MNIEIFEKYRLNYTEYLRVEELPEIIDKDVCYIRVNSKIIELYENNNGNLKLLTVGNCGYFPLLQLFLKKYRANPELLPKDIINKHTMDYYTSEIIYDVMKLLLEPLTNYEEFKALVDRANKEIKPKILANLWGYGTEEYNKRFGHPAVLFGKDFSFINSKDELIKGNSYINMNGTLVEWEDRHYSLDFIYCDKENGIYEIWYFLEEERTSAEYFEMALKFYEEKHLYEYLLNATLKAIIY